MTVTELPAAWTNPASGTRHRGRAGHHSGHELVRAPFPGTVNEPSGSRLPTVGEVVLPGQPLALLETAGGHIEVVASSRGIVSSVVAAAGRPVHRRAVLFGIETG